MDDTTTELPGRKRRRPAGTPKGRQIDPRALEEVRALLGDRPRRRDLLIEYLHLLQDRYGHLSAPHLAALAAEMKLAQSEIYEVATFYAHFDVVKDGPPPPAITVRVCDSLSCAMAGAHELLAELPGNLGVDVRVMRAPCVGACDRAPVAAVGHVQVMKATPANVAAAVPSTPMPAPTRPRWTSRPTVRPAATPCWSMPVGKRTRDDVIKIVSDAGPARAGRRRLPDRPEMDAGPPGAGAPPDGGQRRRGRARHVQGPLLSGARSASLPRRHADRRLGGRGARHLLLSARRISPNPPDAGDGDRQGRGGEASPRTPTIHLRRGAGAYICGEESAMLEAIEGKRGCRGTARPISPRSASSAGRPWFTTSRRSTGCATSSSRAPTGSPATAGTAARVCAASRSRDG